MLLQEKIGNLKSRNYNHKNIDWLELQWYETNKRLFRKKTKSGKEIAWKCLNSKPELTEGDIIQEDADSLIAITVLPCACLVISPKNNLETANICYEIGNKHLPLFYENNDLLVPFEQPLLQLLEAQGYTIKQEERQLLYPLKTTVSPHSANGESLWSKILKRTTHE